METIIRVTIITGFLGSGKTTLLRGLVHETKAERLAVIINDMSDLEVDADLVRDPELLNEERGNFASICSGSIHDGQRSAFAAQLDAWKHRIDIDHLVIETSGSTAPATLVHEILQRPEYRLSSFVVMVDAKAMADDFMLGRHLGEAASATASNTPAHLMVEQLRLATHVLVSKSDRITTAQLQRIAANLTKIQPKAELLAVNYGKISPSRILGTDRFDVAQVGTLPNSTSAQDIGSTVINDPRPLHPRRLWTLYREQLGTGIHRSKGFIWMPSRDREVLLWNQAGGMIEMELTAYWKAALVTNPDGKLVREEIKMLEQMLEGTHPVFGDRACELTIIGTKHDRDVFVPAMMNCFSTEDEIAAWRRGESFDDPWPKNLRQVRYGMECWSVGQKQNSTTPPSLPPASWRSSGRPR